MLHELKTDRAAFDAVEKGLKTFEIRKDDRGFCEGDTLHLHETKYTGAEMAAGAPLLYTGRRVIKGVSHMLKGPIYGLSAGWVILSLSLFLASCTTLDPLGSPAQNPETGERDYITRGGVICRELMGNVQGAGFGDAHGGGFRCLDVGENAPEGCIKYTDGRFSYTSPGCE